MSTQTQVNDVATRQKAQQRVAVDVLQSIERQLSAITVMNRRHPASMAVRIVWELYVLFALVILVAFFFGLSYADTVMQEAVFGVVASTMLIAGYTISRAIDRFRMLV